MKKVISKLDGKEYFVAVCNDESNTMLIYFKGESVGSVSGSDEIVLYCKSKNILLRLKEPSTHREAVDWVKAHAQQLWDKYDFTAKFKE